jgi:hypothetical protein
MAERLNEDYEGRLPENQEPLYPVRRALATAPSDDEPVTEQDRQRFHNGQAWFAERGKGIPMEEVLAEFGARSDDCSRGGPGYRHSPV